MRNRKEGNPKQKGKDQPWVREKIYFPLRRNGKRKRLVVEGDILGIGRLGS